MITTIQIDDKVKEKLDKLKVHHRESYNELIARLVSSSYSSPTERESLVETINTLSDPQVMRDIAEAMEEYNRGEGIDFEDLKKELNLNV